MTGDIKVMHEPWADPGVLLPDYASNGAAGADLRANFSQEDREGITLAPGERALIPTGFRIALPDGVEMQVRARSGLSLKHGVTLANSVGTVDSDYRGPVGVILINLGDNPFIVTHGMRVAQAVIAPVTRAVFRVVDTLDDTDRGAGGFGSTGTA